MSFGVPSCEMTQLITIERLTGHSAMGAQAIYNPTVIVRGYYEQGVKRVVNNKGELILGSSMVILPAGTVATASDRVTVNGIPHKAIDVQNCRLMGREHHVEVILQGIS